MRCCHSSCHLDIEGQAVRARWDDTGDFQAITINAANKLPGQPLQHGDLVALQAVTAKTEAELVFHGIVPSATRPGSLPPDFTGVAVDASGDPKQPVWTLRRAAGEGEVMSEDKVFFEAGGRRLAVVLGWAVALEGEHDHSEFEIQIKGYPAPPRIGFKGTLCEGFEEVEWFGRGPHESYVDRHASARVGRFRGRIVDQTFKYVRPQENGNKFETRWMALRRRPGAAAACGGLLLAARPPSPVLGMQCHRFALSDFDGGKVKEKQAFRHGGDLVERAETTFCVDAAHMGVGGIDSWGRKPLPQHMIGPTQEFDWSFELRPLGAEEQLP